MTMPGQNHTHQLEEMLQQLPAPVRAKVDACRARLAQIVTRTGDHGLIALAMLGSLFMGQESESLKGLTNNATPQDLATIADIRKELAAVIESHGEHGLVALAAAIVDGEKSRESRRVKMTF